MANVQNMGGPPAVLESLNVTENNRTYTPPSGVDGYNEVNVSIPQTIFVGSDIPTSDIGSDGAYYYRRSLYVSHPTPCATFPTTITGTSGTTTNGYKIRTNTTCKAVAIQAYVRSTGDVTVTLYDSNGIVILMTTAITVTTGWVEIPISETELTANTYYYVTVSASSAIFAYWLKSSVTTIPQITIEGGVYGPSLTLDTNNVYSANLVIDIPTQYNHLFAYEQYYKNGSNWELITPV